MRIFNRTKASEEPEKKPVSNTWTVMVKEPKKGERYWHYDFRRGTVKEVIVKKGVITFPKGVGPVIPAINEKNAIRKGRKIHNEQIEKMRDEEDKKSEK